MTSQSKRGEEARLLLAPRDLDLPHPGDIEKFDRIARMTCKLFNVTFAAVSLGDRDRHWFRATAAAGVRELAEGAARHALAAARPPMLVVPDVSADARFAGTPLVAAGVRFYAGVSLTEPSGTAVGAFCVMDDQPRMLSPEEQQALSEMARLAMDQLEQTDPLTHLPTRHHFLRDVRQLARTRAGSPMVALRIDIASPVDFNRALSVLGGACVDEMMLSLCRQLRERLGQRTPLYRVDCTAYLALLEGAEGSVWRDVVTDLASVLATPVWSGGVPLAMKAVFGVVPFDLGRTSPHDVVRQAMAAAQQAREAAEPFGLHCAASEAAAGRRLRIMVDLHPAMQRPDQLSLAFQPRLEVATGRCVGAEALLRWRHPELGHIPPGEFIPLVEQTALARPVTEWVIDAALRQLAAWARSGHALRASVNVSAYNLEEADFAARLGAALRHHRVDPARLELEVTETALVGSGARVQYQLEKVRMMGVEIAIDDFGTGYSTFSYLMRIPASTVKLDQSFMRRLSLSQRDQTLVRSMVAMAHDLGFRVVAEGVETTETLQILADARCDEAQGYLICRPVAADVLETWLGERDGQLLDMP